MTVVDIMNILLGKIKGQFLSVMYETNLEDELSKIAVKNAIKNGNAIPIFTKETTMTVMSGITYDNRKEVKEARANGHLPKNNAGLPFGNWKKGLEGYIVEHTNKKNEYNEYVRLYPTYNKEHKINAKTIYKVNGVETSKEDLRKLGLFKDSFFNPKGTTEEYEMLNYLLLKEQATQLDTTEQKTLDDLRFKLMPQCMTINVSNISAIC